MLKNEGRTYMPSDTNDLAIVSVSQVSKDVVRGALLTEYTVEYAVKEQKFSVQMFHDKGDDEEWYLNTAQIITSLELYHGKTSQEMGKMRDKNRYALASRIISLAKEHAGIM